MRTLERKIGRMLHVGFDGIEAPRYILDGLATGRFGGLILFSRNIGTPEQVARLVTTCREAANQPILIGIDQEGGRVARLRHGYSESPGALALGAADSEALAEEVSAVLATEMHALGINWALAPVVDIAFNSANPVIGTRAIGADPAQVARLALAEIRGFQRGGVAATAKHFPGHGNTPVDTHVDMAVVSGALDDLWGQDLYPFRQAIAARVDAVMLSHVKFPALDAHHPATLSRPLATDLLRERMGFTGLVCTDCMEMDALNRYYDIGERAVLSAQAGADVIFFSHTESYQEEAFAALLQAVHAGDLPLEQVEASARRIDQLAARYPVDAPDLSVIQHPTHLATMRDAAQAGTVLLHADSSVFPLREDHDLLLVEFASWLETDAVEQEKDTGLARLLHTELPAIPTVGLDVNHLKPAALEALYQRVAQAGVTLLVTRNAHLWQDELDVAQAIIRHAQEVILLCLCNPYDAAALPQAGTVICTNGDGASSLQAAVDALLGRFTPTGRLSVPLESPTP